MAYFSVSNSHGLEGKNAMKNRDFIAVASRLFLGGPEQILDAHERLPGCGLVG